jgi:S-adenosyl-L-methionine hydrolase (adenosine-forming)
VAHPFISFLTDFGPDGPAPICRGVMLGIAPDAQIVDIAHGVRKYAIRDGAYLLWCALPYLPIGTHVAVVDPGVGTDRLPIAIRAVRGDVLVGPDNGLLVPAAERLDGIEEARRIENRDLMLATTSSTFHGRDIFSPAAAHLACGVDLTELGPGVDPETLVRLDIPAPEVGRHRIRATVLYVDRFGNVQLNLSRQDLEAVGFLPGKRIELVFPLERYYAITARTFADARPGDLILYEDSYRNIALALRGGDAAGMLRAAPGAELRIGLVDE